MSDDPGSWNTKLTLAADLRRSCLEMPTMFVPRTDAVPSTNGSSPTIARPIVVLPEPDSPTSPTTSPWPTVSVTPSTARNAGARPRLGYSMATSRRSTTSRSAGALGRRRRRRLRRSASSSARSTVASRRSRRGAAPRAAAAACTGRAARGTPVSPCRTRRSGRCCITSTRSDRSATTPMSWVISRIPASMRSRRSRISLRISACTVTSSAVVGSSAISSLGSSASAWAIIARCRWPPESWCG